MSEASPGKDLSAKAPPVMLRGTPDNLIGVLELVNDSKVAVRVRSLRLREGDYLETRPSGRSRIVLRETVNAGERRRVPIEFSVDPATPPGKYHAVFIDGEQERHAEVEVLAQKGLELLPDRIEIEATPGEEVVVPFVFTNTGNVPLELSVLGVMVLEEEQQICLALQDALGTSKNKGYEAFLDAFTKHLADKKVDFVRLKLVGDGLKLDVGETQGAEVAIHVPGNALPGRTYRARTAILDEPLFLKLHTRSTAAPKRGKRS